MTATEDATRPTRDRAPDRRHAPARRVSRGDDRWPDWLAAFAFVLSTVVVVAWLVPPLNRFFDRSDDPVSLATVPIVPNLVYAAVLFALGVGLRRRLRSAWWAFVVLLLVLPTIGRVVSLASDDRDVLDAVGLVVAGTLLVLAVLARRQFTARTARRAGLRALLLFVVGVVVVSLVGTWLLTSFANADEVGAGESVANVLLGDLGLVADPGVVAPLWVRVLLNVMGAAVVLGSAAVLFRSPAYTRTLGAADEAAVRTMLRDHGDLDSLGYFATRRDKAVVWDHEDPTQARAGVSYRVVRGVSLASGNPVGDPEHWPAAIEAWRRDARANGWSLAVMAAGSEGARAFEEAGLTVFEIGDEAILDLGDFSLNGPGLKPVRQAVSRLRRRGYDVEVRRHDMLTAEDFDRLAASASSWRGDGGDERGFSMALGRLGDPLDGDCVLVEARDGDGRLRGFISLVPWGRGGLSLDLMRRDPAADNGLVELIVSSLAEQAPRLAVRRVSLNFAMFREAFTRGEELGAGPMARLGRQALLLASRNWQLESLYRSNAKYLPEWQPRFICFEYSSDLPRVGVAAGSAEGFLTAPSIGSILRRRGSDTGELEHADEAYAAQVRQAIPAEPDRLEQALTARRLPDQERVRRAKLARLQEAGIDPYPVGYPRTHALSEVRSGAGHLPAGTRTPHVVSVVGRVMRKRDHGGLCFLTIRDGSGDLQVLASRAVLGDEQHRLFRSLDLGDHVGVTGDVITSDRRELQRRRPLVRADLEVAAAATRQAPRPHRPRGAGADALRRPDRAPGRPRHRVPALDGGAQHPGVAAEPRLRRGRDADAAARARWRQRPPVRSPTSTPTTSSCTCGSRPSCTSSGSWSAAWSRSSSSTGSFRNEGADSSHNPEFTLLEVYEDLRRLRLDAAAHPGAHQGGGGRGVRPPGGPAAAARRHDRGVRPLR